MTPGDANPPFLPLPIPLPLLSPPLFGTPLPPFFLTSPPFPVVFLSSSPLLRSSSLLFPYSFPLFRFSYSPLPLYGLLWNRAAGITPGVVLSVWYCLVLEEGKQGNSVGKTCCDSESEPLAPQNALKGAIILLLVCMCFQSVQQAELVF